MKRFTVIAFIIVSLFAFRNIAKASEPAACDVTDSVRITAEGVDNVASIPNGSHTSWSNIKAGAVINVDSQEEMGFLYVKYQAIASPYTLRDNKTGETFICGTNGFLHELMDFGSIFGHSCTSVTLVFNESGSKICSINAFSPGTLPHNVQRWDKPLDGDADIVLFCTHGDDDQLFFAGIMPYYAGECGYRFQVAYFTDHHNQVAYRVHEMLDGLWAVGIRAYPVFGPFPDFSESSMEKCYERLAKYNYTTDDIEAYVTEQIRRFRPLVAVGHDLNGEYGHVQHRLYSHALAEAVMKSADPAFHPESAARYGTWDVPKTYLHLYGENKIVLDLDTPLEAFGGLTAFRVTRDLGFPCHDSQLKTRYFDWIHSSETAGAIESYNPCRYGLYRSLVGTDSRNDIFDQIITRENMYVNGNAAMETKYVKFAEMQERKELLRLEKLEEQRILEEAEAKRLEEERAEAEALMAREAEERRLAEEERIREEEAALEALREEAERAAAHRRAAHKQYEKNVILTVAVCAVLIVGAIHVPFPPRKQKVQVQ